MECPVCTFKLRGSREEGFRCVRCHCHFSAKFIRHVRKSHFKQLIHTHFGQPQVMDVEEETFEFADPATEAVVTEAVHAEETLDDYIDLTELAEDPLEHIAQKMPHELLQKERVQYTVQTPARVKKKRVRSKKKTATRKKATRRRR